jgi:uncharacterized membrane protein HdeD (DUF308 family)
MNDMWIVSFVQGCISTFLGVALVSSSITAKTKFDKILDIVLGVANVLCGIWNFQTAFDDRSKEIRSKKAKEEIEVKAEEKSKEEKKSGIDVYDLFGDI